MEKKKPNQQPEQDYSKWSAKKLQERLEEIYSRLADLRERFPRWPVCNVGADGKPEVPPAYWEMNRLDDERYKIVTELSKTPPPKRIRRNPMRAGIPKINVSAREQAELFLLLVPPRDVLEALRMVRPSLIKALEAPDGRFNRIRAVTKLSDRPLAEFLRKLAEGVKPFTRFLTYCDSREETRSLLAGLQNKGVNLRKIFEWLCAYVENPPQLAARLKASDRRLRSKINRQVRRGELTPALGSGLHAREDAAFSLKRSGCGHLTPLLFAASVYLEIKTGRRPAASGLALLIEAVRAAMMRWPLDVSREAVARELSRFKRRNASYLVPRLTSEVVSVIAGSPRENPLLPFVGDLRSQELYASTTASPRFSHSSPSPTKPTKAPASERTESPSTA